MQDGKFVGTRTVTVDILQSGRIEDWALDPDSCIVAVTVSIFVVSGKVHV